MSAYTRQQLDRRNARHRERMQTDPEYAERYARRKRRWAQANTKAKRPRPRILD